MPAEISIPEYNASHVTTMDPMQHIRKFPGMYLGAFDTIKGLNHQIKEAVDNSLDEARETSFQEHVIQVVIGQMPNAIQFMIVDTGRGIPISALKMSYSVPRTSGKWNTAYSTSVGVHGVGIKAVSGISKRVLVISSTNEGTGILGMNEGDVTLSVTRPGTILKRTGTIAIFETDPTFMTCAKDFSLEGISELKDLLTFFSAFTPATIQFQFYVVNGPLFDLAEDVVRDVKGTRAEQALCKEYISKYGLNPKWITDGKPTTIVIPNCDKRDYTINHFGCTGSPVWSVQGQHNVDLGKHPNQANFEFDIWVNNKLSSGIVGAVNMVPIHDNGSYHIHCLVTAIKERIIDHIQDTEVRAFVQSNHYKMPLCGSVEVTVRIPKFDNQTKSGYHDRAFMDTYTRQLAHTLSNKPEDWADLYELLSDDITQQYSKYRNQNLGLNKDIHKLDLNRPERFKACDTTDCNISELYIVEGNSAGGSISTTRESAWQAVFLMSGKFHNVERATPAMLRGNEMLQDLIKVIGVAFGSSNIDNLNFGKIILAQDADPDGSHIQALMISLLHAMSPALFTDGHVYVAEPPLFSVFLPGDRQVFVRDERALDEMRTEYMYIPALPMALHHRTTGVKLHKTDTIDSDFYHAFTTNVLTVGRMLEHWSSVLCIDATLLEALVPAVEYLDIRKPNVQKIKDILGVDRVIHDAQSNTLLLTLGQIDLVVTLDQLAETITSQLIPTMTECHWYQVVPKLFLPERTGYVSFSELYKHMKHLDKQLDCRRNKGLGEMTPAELYRTIIDPTTRTIRQINEIGDYEEIKAMMGSNTKARKKLFDVLS